MARPEIEIPKSNVVKSLEVSSISLVFVGAQTLLTPLLLEINKDLSVSATRDIAFGLYTASLLAGISLEIWELKKKGYTAVPITMFVNGFIKNPNLAPVFSSILNIGHSVIVNPTDIASIASVIAGDNGQIFYNNLISRSITTSSYHALTAPLILTGKVDVFNETILKGWKKVSDATDFVYRKSGVRKFDIWLYPPRVPSYPDMPRMKREF